MSSSALLKKSDAVIEWYWAHGVRRDDPRYSVSRGNWLDAVYRVRGTARTISKLTGRTG